MFYKSITSFNQVSILPNTLVICDIDETILRYDSINSQWWNNRKNNYMQQSYSYEMSDKMALNDWKLYINETKPVATDLNGIMQLITLILSLNSQLILLTARENELKNITHQHLLYSGIDISSDIIHFSYGQSKGEYISRYINHMFDKYDKIIFIDDYIVNLESVYKKYGNQIDYYKFVMDE